jgi:hypothetical protein
MLHNCASVFKVAQLEDRPWMSGVYNDALLSSAGSNVFFLQKVRQSPNLVYAFTDDAFNLLLSDDRYVTAEHVDPRHRSSSHYCYYYAAYTIDIRAGLNASTFVRRKDEMR